MDLTLLYKEYLASSGISTDTRKIQHNQLFFALRGPNFNANKLAEEAISKGARLAIIDDPDYASLQKTYLVKDSLETLQQLASYHRNQLNIPVICLTGSNGKTTTKELIKVVLEKNYNVLATQGNLNNHIGVPLTVLSITNDHNIAVVEMGANHVGEIADLCAVAKPTHGLITNIGKAHIGEFGGFENIIRAKSELFDFLLKSDGTAFINTLDPVLANMAKRFNKKVLYPSDIEFIDADPFVKIQLSDKDIFTTQLVGSYNFSNIAAAYAIGRFFEINQKDMLAAIEDYIPSNNRSQILKAGTNTILLDAYNANPSSMGEAIKNFSNMKATSKIVILGDMLELGDASDEEHFKVGEAIKSQAFSKAIFVGPLMKKARDAYPDAIHFETRDSLIEYLKKNKISGSYILIKGSRGMALEKVAEVLKEH